MLLSPLALIALPFLVGCNSTYYQKTNMIASKVTMDKAVEGRPSLGQPIVIPKQRVVMVPFVVEHDKHWLESGDAYSSIAKASRSYSNYGHQQQHRGSGMRWHNILFKNLDSQKEWLLTDRRAVVTGYQIVGPQIVDKSAEKRLQPKAILFEITEADTDGDGVLSAGDGTTVFACKPDGTRLRRITPPGSNSLSINYQPGLDLVFINLQTDTNGDGGLSPLDESAPYRFDLESNAAVPLISSETQNIADSILR